MNIDISMIQAFFKNPYATGAISKVGNTSIQHAFQHIDRNQINSILEIGGGEGNITEFVLQHKKKDTHFEVIEMQEIFYTQLIKKFTEDVVVVHDNFLVHEYGDRSFDLIYSTVPLSLLTHSHQAQMIQKTHQHVSAGGTYLHIQYSHLKAAHIKRIFGNVSYSYCFLDFPFTCTLTAKKED